MPLPRARPGSRPLTAALALFLALACAAGPARANMAAVKVNASRVVGPGLARETNLRVEDERLSFTCAETRGTPVCAFEARYTVSNPPRRAALDHRGPW